MRWRAWITGFVVLGLVLALWLFRAPHAPTRDAASLSGDPQRGAYMARAAGCIACHTDSENGGGFLAGGAAIETPFGVFYGPNITPHEDGIGDWTRQQFVQAVTTGQSPDGKPYYPVLPYAHYAGLETQDVVDIWAALQTVPAKPGGPPEHNIAFPLNQRFALRAWQNLFFRPSVYSPDTTRDASWNRGAYLVRAAGHCGACHTPRNLFGARKTGAHLSGNPNGPGGENVPAIRGGALRQAGWSESDIVIALQHGLTPEGDVLGGSMAEMIEQGTSYLSEDDLNAIAAYLWSLE